MKLSIRVNGQLVRQGLEDLQKEIPDIGRRRMRTILERAKRIMEAYPQERPGQRYLRTGRLFRGWQLKKLPSNKGYSLGNSVDYAHYVVGDAYGTSQAWMHTDRWPNFRDVTEKELEALPKEIEQEIVLVARRKGFDAK
jgi:hypothetical protein